MRVLIVSSYEIGHQPQSAAELCADLAADGHDVTFLDISLSHDLERQVLQALSDFRVEPSSESKTEQLIAASDVVLLLTPMLTAASMALTLAKAIKKMNPAIKIATLGLYAKVVYDDATPSIDAAFVGEYQELTRNWLAGGTPGERYETTNRAGHSVKSTPARSRLPHLDRYPQIEVSGQKKYVAYVEASRGCRHNCLHCPIPPVYGGRIRINSAESVLQDIDYLVTAGARHVTFGDPDFLNAPAHSNRIFTELQSRYGSEVTFDATIKVEHILRFPDIIQAMAECNATMITSAVESLNDEVLRRLDKGHTAEQAFGAAEFVQRLGVTFHPSFLPFTPWTKPYDLADIMDFCYYFGLEDLLEPVQYGIRLLIPPGSLLLTIDSDELQIRDYDGSVMGYRWSHVDPAVDRLADSVAKVAAESASAGRSNGETFFEIRELAYGQSGGTPKVPSRGPTLLSATKLAEPWFC